MKTLSIPNINIGRFGNKLIYLNNLFQLSSVFELEPRWPSFEMEDLFEFTNERIDPAPYGEEFNCDFFKGNRDFKFEDGNFGLGLCLGDLFFEYDSVSTHSLFSFRKEIIPTKEEKIKVGIHFRGTDFHSWDSNSILPTEYYTDSIKYVLSQFGDVEFFVATDDLRLSSYFEKVTFLRANECDFTLGNINDAEMDFLTLSFCDIVISSPSTFCIAACFCGKPDKKIINSKKWIDYQVGKKDLFWVGVKNGGNNNYKTHLII